MLTTWDPFRDVERLFEVDPRTRSIPAPFDAVRTADEVVLTYDLPGFRADDVDVTVENHVLTLTASRTQAELPEGAQRLVAERRFGTVRRQVTLSDTLDGQNISAHFDNGVLELRIPVSEKAQAVKVPIGVGATSIDAESSSTSDEAAGAASN
ncbi:MAG: Hsp20/alpha crystallin family protein [Candidatus Microthrix sp.]|nr:Hsp20/alpha crystallin family protein [Candidatus Microthrix sp.]MBK9559478.1 Hsp20/alpha crystallin family protein [Candidatus Microthrix sp.]